MRQLLFAPLALCLCAALATSQDEAAPGLRITERAQADIAKLLPQRGLGGDATEKVDSAKTTFETLKIEAEGCEAMEGYIALPEDIPEGHKCALMFTFHGNGDVGSGRVKNVSRINTTRDPIITIGVQYQQLKDGKGEMGQPLLADGKTVIAGCRWLLNHVIAKHPVDTERVFVSGFSMGTGYASGWAAKEWREDPENFPFRAVFLYSSGGALDPKDCPPVPWICTVGSEETAILGSINVVESVRHFCNVVASWGKPVQYHEIPGMGHQVNGRCHQITADVIADLGGPGALSYSTDTGDALEPLPFDASDDVYVKEVVALCNADEWQAALDRVTAIDKDKAIESKAKRAVKHFDKEIEKIAKKEVKRVDDLIAAAIKDEKMPAMCLVNRLRAISETWAAETWVKGKGYDTRLQFLAGDFAPVVREREREQQMRDAWALESQKDKRAEAKALYEALAARKDEDEGKSVWPRAAAYRLSWWIDGDK